MGSLEVLKPYEVAEVSRITIRGKVLRKRFLRKPEETPIAITLVVDNVRHWLRIVAQEGLDIQIAKNDGLRLSFSCWEEAWSLEK